MPVGGFQVDAGFQLDQLSMAFVLLVTFVGSLIHVYSVGYMEHDDDRRRFFAYLNLFVAAMLLLVLADNYLLLYVGWEGVGLASYLLIGFWNHKPERRDRGEEGVRRQPGRRHRPVDRDHADVRHVRRVRLRRCFARRRHASTQRHAHRRSACMLLLGRLRQVGAVPAAVLARRRDGRPDPGVGADPRGDHGDRRRLPDRPLARRSSTPRPTRSSRSSIVGAITLLFGAIVGCAKDDIKKALAASTMSQIGYMMLAAGLGPVGYAFAIFHLLTHGFFKAGMFLGAGSVMHGMNDQVDMRRFGGLRKYMPITCVTFGLGWLAIIGFPPFSGFWSKDKIIEAAFAKGGTAGWVFGARRAARRRRSPRST